MPKSLSDLLRHTEHISLVKGSIKHCLIDDICLDSRKAGPGSLFFALPGTDRDGTDFISQALKKGAVAVVVPEYFAERAETQVPEGTVLLSSDEPRTALGQIADAFFNHPSRAVKVIGITGTNGKTTCSFLLERILLSSGSKYSLTGTIIQKTGTRSNTSSITTPDVVSFQRFLAETAREEAEYALVEVSSHGLIQARVEGCRFEAAIFTNLSHDHLDYHGDMEEYFQAKRLLFTRYKPRLAVINIDDKWGRKLWDEYQGPKVSYGFSEKCMVAPAKYEISASGIEAEIKLGNRHLAINSPLMGSHNLYNILAAAAAADGLGIGLNHIREGIESLRSVPGRLEKISSYDITALVDYAHTPHALQNVLEGLRSLKTGRVITVIGCGGDRDRTKRPEMAKIAAELSDFTIFTSDNPRTESAEAILEDMLSGVSRDLMAKVEVVKERRQAIFRAVSLARPKDMVLVAGKGHEDYQIIGKTKFPFDDRKVLKEALETRQNPGRQHTCKERLNITIGKLEKILSGKLLSGRSDTMFSSVCTDSRTIKPGQLFWALRGENFDGHAFVQASAARKAAGAVVEYKPEGLPGEFPIIQVRDSLESLGDFAAWYKRAIGANVFAITGSCGKTTTKELVLSVLKTSFNASGTRGNFNNLIGLPLTILSLEPGTQWAVLEMGTNLPGEIDRLCKIAGPKAGLITCIRPVHLEGLGTLENIALEKTTLFRSLPEEGTAVVNLDDPMLTTHISAIKCRRLTGYTTRVIKRDKRFEKLVVLNDLVQGPQGLEVRLDICGEPVTIKSRLFGRINSVNILAAAAAGAALGIDTRLIKEGIENVKAPSGRMHTRNLPGGWLLMDDSYNANPSSVKAAMEAISEIALDKKKTFVLGDMLELGPRAREFHWQTGQQAAACRPDLLLAVGNLAEHLADGALAADLPKSRIFTFESADSLLKWMAQDPAGFFNGSRRAVLVKASRGIGLEKVVSFIEKRLEGGK